jgi:ABC-type nitrate/sulfonate/bicarbonate transport system ATPase subunit/ABC-type nitrate/sulfonate/bicarbonate transport system permease component
VIACKKLSWLPGGVRIVEDFSLEVAAGSIVAIVGRSGCGKSSLLRLVAGLREKSGGELIGVPEQKAFVFQDPALLPWLTVLENLALVAKLQGRVCSEAELAEVLKRVGLQGQGQKLPAMLSGGQRMRVSLARVLLSKPKLVLLDEAFAALDFATRRAIQRDFLACAQAEQWTVLLVTHDPEEALLLADRVLLVAGPPVKVLEDKLNPGPKQIPMTRLEQGSEELPVVKREPVDFKRMALSLLLGAGVWALAAWAAGPLLLPGPIAVAQVMLEKPGMLVGAMLQTALAAGLGLLGALLLGVGMAVAGWRSRLLQVLQAPYLAILQVIPIVAIAPLMVVWLGYGLPVACTTAMIAALYPIYAGAALGLRAPSTELLDLFALYGARLWQELLWLRLPAAWPALGAGVETAAGLSVIGAIVGEFVGSNGSPPCLGYLVVAGSRGASPELSFAAVVGAGVVAFVLRRVGRIGAGLRFYA